MSVSFQPGSVGSTRNVRQESIPEQQQSTMVKTRNIHTTSSSDVVLPAGSTDGEVEGEKGKGKKTAKIRGGGGKKGGGKAAKGKKKTYGEETDAGESIESFPLDVLASLRFRIIAKKKAPPSNPLEPSRNNSLSQSATTIDW